ncbi:MAG TPA: PqqD family protein [Pyrinomonadaceae bacterium]
MFKPRARERDLIVEELKDETLVYDLESHRAHCLNRSAALVWKQCDGRRSVAEIAGNLSREFPAGADDEMVSFALEQLAKFKLLEERGGKPAGAKTGLTRREMMRRLGLAAAVGIPLVTSIVAPTPAQASTCIPSDGACTSSAQCCSGVCAGETCA